MQNADRIVRKFPVFTLLFLLLTLSFSIAMGADDDEMTASFSQRHQMGIRLGAWVNQGDKIPSSSTTDSISFESKIKDGSFMFEAYGAIRFSRLFLGEISFGVTNRGSVTIVEQNLVSDIGNLMLYPILLEFRIYPLLDSSPKFKPFLTIGGGLYYARQSIQFSNSYWDTSYRERSATDFNYTIGGGFDWPLSDILALELSSKYFPIQFSKPLLTAEDFSSFSITIGIKYLYQKKKK